MGIDMTKDMNKKGFYFDKFNSDEITLTIKKDGKGVKVGIINAIQYQVVTEGEPRYWFGSPDAQGYTSGSIGITGVLQIDTLNKALITELIESFETATYEADDNISFSIDSGENGEGEFQISKNKRTTNNVDEFGVFDIEIVASKGDISATEKLIGVKMFSSEGTLGIDSIDTTEQYGFMALDKESLTMTDMDFATGRDYGNVGSIGVNTPVPVVPLVEEGSTSEGN